MLVTPSGPKNSSRFGEPSQCWVSFLACMASARGPGYQSDTVRHRSPELRAFAKDLSWQDAAGVFNQGPLWQNVQQGRRAIDLGDQPQLFLSCIPGLAVRFLRGRLDHQRLGAAVPGRSQPNLRRGPDRRPPVTRTSPATLGWRGSSRVPAVRLPITSRVNRTSSRQILTALPWTQCVACPTSGAIATSWPRPAAWECSRLSGVRNPGPEYCRSARRLPLAGVLDCGRRARGGARPQRRPGQGRRAGARLHWRFPVP